MLRSYFDQIAKDKDLCKTLLLLTGSLTGLWIKVPLLLAHTAAHTAAADCCCCCCLLHMLLLLVVAAADCCCC